MVEKLQTLLRSIESEKAPVCIFAVVKIDDVTDRWTVILSADWITEENTKETFEFLVKKLLNDLGDEVDLIAHVGIYTKDEHLVEDLLKYKTGTHITESVRANGNTIHEAYIIKSEV